jgi:hypothetical protein
VTHDWELTWVAGTWAWVCLCGEDRVGFDSDDLAGMSAEDHLVAA